MCQAITKSRTRCKLNPGRNPCHLHGTSSKKITPKRRRQLEDLGTIIATQMWSPASLAGMKRTNKGKYCPHTGTEPSPKGYNYCARNMPVGAVLPGNKDTDSLWIVRATSTGAKRWVRLG